jgi:MFS family permease
MEDAGWLESTAGLTGSLYALAGIISAVGMGVLSDRLGKRKVIIIFAGIVFTTAFVFAAIGVSHELYLLLAFSLPLSGFAAYSGQPLCYALAVEKLDADQVSIAYGFIMAVGLIFGALVYPLALGAIKDLTGNYVVGFSAVAVSLLALNVIAVFFMKDHKPTTA